MYPTRLDTYGCGCEHDCKYCYAKGLLEFRKLWDADNPRVASIDKIEKAIQKLPPGFIVRMGGMTDCFQPSELRCNITLETIKLLNKYGIGYLIVTKSPIISYPTYTDIMNRELAHIQISVTCLDHNLSKRYERAHPPDQRIMAIMELQDKGFDTAIRLSPLLEEYIDFDKLNSMNIQKCIVEFLRLNSWIKEWFSMIDSSSYTLRTGNYYHLPLEEKLRIINKIKLKNVSVCDDVPEHYDYWKMNYNPNSLDCCNLRVEQQNKTTLPEILNLTD